MHATARAQRERGQPPRTALHPLSAACHRTTSLGFAGTALGRALSQCRRTLSCGPQRVPRHQRHSGRTQPPLSPRLQAAAAGARRGAVQVRTASAATVPWQPSAPRLCGTGNARGSERQARRPGPAGCATKECLSTRPPGGTKAAAGPITPITTHFISVPCISPTDARWGRGGRRAPTSTSAQGGTRCDMRSAVAAALALGIHLAARARVREPDDPLRQSGMFLQFETLEIRHKQTGCSHHFFQILVLETCQRCGNPFTSRKAHGEQRRPPRD